MQKDCSVFPIPSFAKREVEDFDAVTQKSLEVYQELNAIAEEIEACRLRNS
jgi:hypothetical protein